MNSALHHHPFPWLARRTRSLLTAFGVTNVEHVVSDLSEEAAYRLKRQAGQLRVVSWWIHEVVTVLGHDVRDRLRVPSKQAITTFAEARLYHPFRLAIRSFRREPTTALFAALTLSVGFGAAAANFSAIAGFTRPLPVPDGHEVVRVEVTTPGSVAGGSGLTLSEARMVASQTPFASSGVFAPGSAIIGTAGHPSRRVSMAAADPGVFGTLRVSPLLGRLPVPEDGAEAALIGEDLWRGWLDANPDVLGITITMDETQRTIIGVMPSHFRFPIYQELWTSLDPAGANGGGDVVGRLAPGVTREAATQQLETLVRAERSAADGDAARMRVLEFTEARGEGGELQALAALLLIVVALVLVSCSNVSSLLLLRGTARARTLSLHRALGATPSQVALQILAESAVIALMGAVVGVFVAWGLVAFLETKLQDHWGFHWMDMGLQPSVLLFLGALATITALAAGTVPAIRAARGNLIEPLKSEAAANRGRRSTFGSWAFLSVQLALSSVALAASILMATGLVAMRRVGGDLDPRTVVQASVTLDGPRYATAAQRADLQRRLVTDLHKQEVFEQVAVSSGLPVIGGPFRPVEIEGMPPRENGRPRAAFEYGVSDGFFALHALALRAGRAFLTGDGQGSEPVGVVTAGFVNRYLPGVDPLNRRVRVGGEDGDTDWISIVGVVDDLLLVDRDRDRDAAILYRPLGQVDAATLYVSAVGADAAAALESTIRAVDGDLALGGSFTGPGVTTLDDLLSYMLRFYEIAALLAILGGTAALLVVAIGLYGVLAFEVQQQLPAFGIRIALGANRARIISSVMVHGLSRVVPGLALGLLISWFATPLFGVFLTGVDPHSPIVFGGVFGAAVLITCIAAGAPGRRAANADPASVLRTD